MIDAGLRKAQWKGQLALMRELAADADAESASRMLRELYREVVLPLNRRCPPHENLVKRGSLVVESLTQTG